MEEWTGRGFINGLTVQRMLLLSTRTIRLQLSLFGFMLFPFRASVTQTLPSKGLRPAGPDSPGSTGRKFFLRVASGGQNGLLEPIALDELGQFDEFLIIRWFFKVGVGPQLVGVFHVFLAGRCR